MAVCLTGKAGSPLSMCIQVQLKGNKVSRCANTGFESSSLIIPAGPLEEKTQQRKPSGEELQSFSELNMDIKAVVGYIYCCGVCTAHIVLRVNCNNGLKPKSPQGIFAQPVVVVVVQWVLPMIKFPLFFCKLHLILSLLSWISWMHLRE